MDATIQKILSGEFQEVHAFLRASDGRQLSPTVVAAIRFKRHGSDMSFDIDRQIELFATTSGGNAVVHFETADGLTVLDFSVLNFESEYGKSEHAVVGQSYGLSPHSS